MWYEGINCKSCFWSHHCLSYCIVMDWSNTICKKNIHKKFQGSILHNLVHNMLYDSCLSIVQCSTIRKETSLEIQDFLQVMECLVDCWLVSLAVCVQGRGCADSIEMIFSHRIFDCYPAMICLLFDLIVSLHYKMFVIRNILFKFKATFFLVDDRIPVQAENLTERNQP